LDFVIDGICDRLLDLLFILKNSCGTMVKITPDAEKFIDELLEKNQKVGFGIKIYLSGFACSGPQFGMSFQEKAVEGEEIDKSATSFEMYYDHETEQALKDCVIEFIDDPNFGTGLSIRNPNFDGCASCGGGCH
jgi:iron-sulfur cluster assembly protein